MLNHGYCLILSNRSYVVRVVSRRVLFAKQVAARLFYRTEWFTSLI